MEFLQSQYNYSDYFSELKSNNAGYKSGLIYCQNRNVSVYTRHIINYILINLQAFYV